GRSGVKAGSLKPAGAVTTRTSRHRPTRVGQQGGEGRSTNPPRHPPTRRRQSAGPPLSSRRYGSCSSNACAITPYPLEFAWISGPSGGGAQTHVHWHSRSTSSGGPSPRVVSST